MKTLMTVTCNWCETTSTEDELVIILDTEHCPQCGEIGCLMDTKETAQ